MMQTSGGSRWLGWFGVLVGLCAPATIAAEPETESVVVVYTALDRQFSEPIFADFTRETGIRVEPVFDTESNKTVGLTNRIRAEARRPRCDVFWNNEIVNTLRLRQAGLLQPYRSAEAENYPAQFRDPEGYWYGFAARARVIIVNRQLVPSAEDPRSIRALADPRWRGRTGIARPLFGTTASHVACLFEKLGPDSARGLLRDMLANDVQIVSGNKPAADFVAAGKLAFALTDTDDYMVVREAGAPVDVIFPDSETGGLGTLLLPNTLAVVAGAPHPRAAGRLVDYLLSAEVEARLARGPSAQIPLHRQAPVRSRVWPEGVQIMSVDFARAAEHFETAAEFIEKEFLR